MRHDRVDTDVLVVGAGPTGLALTAALADRGVEVTLVDRRSGGVGTSRAAVVHDRTLEALAPLGVVDALVGRGLRAHRFTIRDRDRLLVPIRFDRLPVPHPYALMVPQSSTEEILTDRVRRGGREVVPDTELVSLAQDRDGVTATLADGGTVRARWLVGADGLNSTVRRAVGIGFTGKDTAESFSLADARVSGPLPRDEVVLFFSPDGMLVSAPLPDGAFRFVAAVPAPPEQPDAAHLQRLLATRGPAAPRVEAEEVTWGSRFRVHHRVADRYRAGRVLLLGDAAHVHSPAGGQGMNLGLRDAMALAGLLAPAVADDAPPEALDAYTAARRPAALRVLRLAGRLTRLATAPAPLRPARNALLAAASTSAAFRNTLTRDLAGLNDR
ncbi:FAD-dependent oxidoreductase [Allostreptomyces psammosilenae]|uniref:2-polyprenyl-6-methoxyphenol hydroxylase-like FAD-dependent oxidoreductase n=1 Tax=Allostreptomyces psammosilenae TaxID=1892865 RepID=A0A853A1I8_9ACTN|nr:FAD-dependent oxidoreductase [Allostreptomyces psammosilenae]NYI08229.1 2-polyprenyl-6-methoxyphenol hydroxylase-like FAD-dependent oxidoreductase [Allostreptomyces psammosilenae]